MENQMSHLIIFPHCLSIDLTKVLEVIRQCVILIKLCSNQFLHSINKKLSANLKMPKPHCMNVS